MNANLAYATLVGVALTSSAALAQATNPMPKDQPSQATAPDAAQPAQSQPSAANSEAAKGDTFVAKQTTTQWRAPKLIGVDVFGADNQKVGKIKDVLIEHDGSAKVVVIGVGGFLGIGTKDVGVPFTAVQWRTEPRAVPAPDQPSPGPLSSTGGAANRPPPQMADPAATEASQGYPDKAVVGMTLAQLQQAPDFQYAPSPLASRDTGSMGEDKPPRPSN